ncbi:MAG: DUF2867 domain-containing protein [Anaerolineales bacterium]|jgi:hypothetical protein
MKNLKQSHNKPDISIIDRELEGEIHYIDSFSIEFENVNHYSIDYILTALFLSSIPGWVRVLLKLRDILVKPFDLETGPIPEQVNVDTSVRYSIGDRAIIFTVIDRSDTEIVMAEDDKHLYFRTSLCIEKTSRQNLENLHLTTLVQYHNIGGRLYFMPVKPFHRLIMKTMLKKLPHTFK